MITDVEKLRFLKETLSLNKQQLQLTEHQLQLIEHLYQNKVGQGLPIIYAITPTYWRHVQKAELTRVSQTLALVPNIHWIVIEDSEERTELVTNLLNDSKVVYTHLNAKTPPFEKLQKKEERWTKHRGIEQRNAGLQWLRDNLELGRDKGIVYFMDDDNTYSVKLFHEISKACGGLARGAGRRFKRRSADCFRRCCNRMENWLEIKSGIRHGHGRLCDQFESHSGENKRGIFIQNGTRIARE